MGRVVTKVGVNIRIFFQTFIGYHPKYTHVKPASVKILKDPPPPNTLHKYCVATCPKLVPPFSNFQRIVPNLESQMTRYLVKTI